MQEGEPIVMIRAKSWKMLSSREKLFILKALCNRHVV